MFFQIPPEIASSLVQLALISEASYESLLKILEGQFSRIRGQEAAYEYADQVKDVEFTQAFLLLDTLVPLCLNAVAVDNDVTDTTLGVLASILTTDEGRDLSEGQKKTLKKRIAGLLKSKSIRLQAKALNLLTREHSSVFTEVAIFSDARPIFDPDGALKQGAWVIYHNLKIAYVTSGTAQELFVAMDEKDLTALQKMVDRAIKKHRSLTKSLAATGLPILKVE